MDRAQGLLIRAGYRPGAMIRALLVTLGLLLSGCIAASWLEDAVPIDDDDASDDDDAVDDDDGADDDDSATLCRLPVPDHITLEHPVRGDTFVPFYVPTTGWALAALHASMQVEALALQQVELRLSPSYFLALALETGTFGCSESIPPDPADSAVQWPRRPDTDAEGCMQVAEGSVWLDLCRMYPEDLPCDPDGYDDVIPSVDQGATGRDNVQPSVLATAWYAAFAYPMLAYPSGGDAGDVDAWFADAADPVAVEKVLTWMHWQTPFGPAMGEVIADCADGPVEDCLGQPTWVRDRAVAVGAHTEQLAAAPGCFDRPLTAALVDDYVDAIAVLFPTADVSSGRAAAQAALADAGGDGTSFQAVADAVLAALDDGLGVRLRCPGANLTTYYGVSCP